MDDTVHRALVNRYTHISYLYVRSVTFSTHAAIQNPYTDPDSSYKYIHSAKAGVGIAEHGTVSKIMITSYFYNCCLLLVKKLEGRTRSSSASVHLFQFL